MSSQTSCPPKSLLHPSGNRRAPSHLPDYSWRGSHSFSIFFLLSLSRILFFSALPTGAAPDSHLPRPRRRPRLPPGPSRRSCPDRPPLSLLHRLPWSPPQPSLHAARAAASRTGLLLLLRPPASSRLSRGRTARLPLPLAARLLRPADAPGSSDLRRCPVGVRRLRTKIQAPGMADAAWHGGGSPSASDLAWRR